MRGRARRVIYGVLKCTGSQRLKPSWRHSRDSALPCCCNMLHRSHTHSSGHRSLFSYLSAPATLDLFLSDFRESSQVLF